MTPAQTRKGWRFGKPLAASTQMPHSTPPPRCTGPSRAVCLGRIPVPLQAAYHVAILHHQRRAQRRRGRARRRQGHVLGLAHQPAGRWPGHSARSHSCIRHGHIRRGKAVRPGKSCVPLSLPAVPAAVQRGVLHEHHVHPVAVALCTRGAGWTAVNHSSAVTPASRTGREMRNPGSDAHTHGPHK